MPHDLGVIVKVNVVAKIHLLIAACIVTSSRVTLDIINRNEVWLSSEEHDDVTVST